ncbi:hypothetical protein [Candidatus Pelagisphaera phototrophica]|uniref:hypothetical protein n=1 Tax=Candidatus Pelagisphaera phototrophica TaxID=2684113 RepID=UPI001A0E2B31|nr:hypothetical protein [Candidatus Pelagisphaera phototrophica]QXD32623.1 hypothetical protein GA004_02560 [Candidatus Pelagisphaera phototrophica]
MKLAENVGNETSEKGVFNSRTSRMARYSAAAAGVAAVSSLEVDAAMIKVIVTDPLAQGTSFYYLDLSTIKPDTTLHMSQYFSSSESGSAFVAGFNSGQGSVVVSSSYASSHLRSFSNGSTIRGPGDLFGYLSSTSYLSGSSFLLGFRINQGSSDYTNGWFKVTIDGTSSFTLNSYGYNSTLNGAAIAGQGTVAGAPVAGVPDTGPGIVGLALLGAGAAGVRLLRKLRAGK